MPETELPPVKPEGITVRLREETRVMRITMPITAITEIAVLTATMETSIRTTVMKGTGAITSTVVPTAITGTSVTIVRITRAEHRLRHLPKEGWNRQHL